MNNGEFASIVCWVAGIITGINLWDLIIRVVLHKKRFWILNNNKKIKYVEDEECDICEVGAVPGSRLSEGKVKLGGMKPAPKTPRPPFRPTGR